jgi:hypothetical protein
MKSTMRLCWTVSLLSISAAVAVLFSGCATPQERSFNDDFGEQLPAQPMYFIQDENTNEFRINVHQGKHATADERVNNIKEAASAIAKAECQRRGWEKWQLNYIQERDQGWEHVVIAEVTREKYIPPTYPQSNSPNGSP